MSEVTKERIKRAHLRRQGLMVCTQIDSAVFPSFWCTVLGHSFVETTGRRGARCEYIDKECSRCGYHEYWSDWESRDVELAIEDILGEEL